MDLEKYMYISPGFIYLNVFKSTLILNYLIESQQVNCHT